MANSIDSALQKFYNSINIPTLKSSCAELQDKMTFLITANTRVSSSLPSVFSGDASKSVMSKFDVLEAVCQKIKTGIEGELSPTITRAERLKENIGKLIELLNNLNNAISTYNSLKNNPQSRKNAAGEVNPNYSKWQSNLNSAQSSVNKLQNEFNEQHEKLKKEYESLKTVDGSLPTLKSFGSIDSEASKLFNGNYASTFIEKDGMVYQLVTPVTSGGKPYKIEEQYIIAYDMNNLDKTLGEYGNMKYKGGQTYKEYIINTLKNRVSTGQVGGAIWNLEQGHSKETANVMARLMNKVLSDSYNANQFENVSDYAALAAIVSTNNVYVKFFYNGDTKSSYASGYNSIVSNSGWDCIGLVRWSYVQALNKKYGQAATQKYLEIAEKDFSLGNLYYHHSNSLSNMSSAELSSIDIGSVLSTRSHIGVVVGHTTLDNGQKALVVAHSAGRSYGTVTSYYSINNLTEKWGRVTTGDQMLERIMQGDLNTRNT